MSKVRVAAFTLSLDGFGAGPQQSLEHPLGEGGEALGARPQHVRPGARPLAR